jgi:hypothetical protein
LDPIWQRELAEEYGNSTNFSDGEIYRKIYQYNLEQDKFAERKWWARLTKNKSDFLNRFFKHKRFPAVFNALTDLELILQIWSYIFGDDRELMRLVDQESVKMVESKAPGALRHDLELLREPMQEGKLFPLIRDQKERDMIWARLSSIEDLIVIIHTLFKDVKYLRPL